MNKTKTIKKDVVQQRQQKSINIKPMTETLLSYIALVMLAGLSYEGIKSLIDANPNVQMAIGLVLTALLIKTAIKK